MLATNGPTPDTLNDEPMPEGGKGEIAVMDGSGDTKIMWDPANADEVENARENFDRLKAKGFDAFKVADKGEPGERLDKFDPKAGRIIMMPRKVAG
jgi:hypothetical protein